MCYMSSSGMVRDSRLLSLPRYQRKRNPGFFRGSTIFPNFFIKSNMVKYSTEPKDVTKGEFFLFKSFCFDFLMVVVFLD